MTELPPRLTEFASRLLGHEAERTGNAEDPGTAFALVCAGLHERLAPLISAAGFHTLLTRALKLATRDFPLLATTTVDPIDCRLAHRPEASAGLSESTIRDAYTRVLAHFLWLLILFIGEHLSLREVREIWPEIVMGETDPSSEAGR